MTKIFEALQRARQGAMTPDREAPIPKVTLPRNANPSKGNIEMEEEMLYLYNGILGSLPDAGRRAVLFIGSRSNEGTSTIARQLARTVSLRVGKAVLLIDLDRSRPDLHIYRNVNAQEEIETGHSIEAALRQVEDSSLYVMPLSSKTIAEPGVLDRLREDSFWERLKEKFDLIVVDSPPAMLFPDGPGLVSQVDGVVLVVEAEKTRWQVALSVKDKIIKNGGNILGIVFNKRQYYIPQRIYRYL